MHEIMHWAKEYHIYIYIIFQFCPVALSNRRMIFASILHTFNHIIWCSNLKKSYTTCSVWLTFRKNLKRCNGQCALEQPLKQGRLVLKCWRNMLLAGCNLPGIPWNNAILARKLFKICGDMHYIISFDEDEP